MEHCWTFRLSPEQRSRWLSLCRFSNGVDPEPYLAVADLQNASLRLYTEEGIFLRNLVPPSVASWSPCAVAEGEGNSLAVCDWTAGALCLLCLDYRPSFVRAEWLGGASLSRPHDAVMTAAGNWAVADEAGLVLLDPFGATITRGRLHEDVKWSPRHVATDSQQRLFVSDGAGGRVSIFDPAARFLRHLSGVRLRHPSGLLVNDLDQVLVCDQGRACVSLFDSLGRYIYDVITPEQLPHTKDPHLDARLWRPVALTSTTDGQVCLAAAFGDEFVLQCFAYSFMPNSARSARTFNDKT